MESVLETVVTLREHDEFVKRVLDGGARASEVQAHFERVRSSRSSLVAELAAFTKADLINRLPSFYSLKGEKKERLVRQAFDRVLSFHALGQSVSYAVFGSDAAASYEGALAKVVDGLTDEAVASFAKEVAEARAQRHAKLEAMQRGLENPQTLDDFAMFVKVKGERALSADQRARYDDLVAAKTRESIARAAPRVEHAGPASGARLVETKHTRDGYDLFVVVLDQRVNRGEYDRLNAAARNLGGWYSSYRGNGAVAGFQFKEKPAAEAFQQLVTTGDATNAREVAQDRAVARREARKDAAAERLAVLADGLEEDAEERLNQDRLVNTARRARMASSAEAGARADVGLARTLRNLSDALESGEAKNLSGIRHKSHVEELDGLASRARYDRLRKQYPDYAEFERHKGRPLEVEDADHVTWPWAHANLASLVADLAAYNGTERLRHQLRKLPTRPDGWITVPHDLAERVVDKLGSAAQRNSWLLAASVQSVRRLAAMGILNLPSLRAAVREYVRFKDAGPATDRVRELERQLAGNPNVGIEFFPTPEALALRMAGEAQLAPGLLLLEPSAGSGNLIDAAKEVEPGIRVEAVEISVTLVELLEAKGVAVVARDFLEYVPTERYDRVLMNPPFTRDVEHVRHAFAHLKRGGRLVAIMGEGVFFRGDARSREFRSWLDALDGTSESLQDAFTDPRELRTTGARSRLVVVEKRQGNE